MNATPSLAEEFRGVVTASRKPVVFSAEFATTGGILQTLEGTVSYETGDALVTGIRAERWPVPRAYFETAYAPEGNSEYGQNGEFRRRPEPVLALRLDAPILLKLPEQRGTLSGNTGDWLIERASGERSIVAGDIFALTYDILQVS